MRNKMGISIAIVALLAFVFGFGTMGCSHKSGTTKADAAVCKAECGCTACAKNCEAGKGWCEGHKHGCADGKMTNCKSCAEAGTCCKTCTANMKK